MNTEFDSDTAIGQWAADDVAQCYVSWCEACYLVRVAYRLWCDSTRAERRLTYAAYVAALDREERAAFIYADQIERLSASRYDPTW
jgi:hypothetical protein